MEKVILNRIQDLETMPIRKDLQDIVVYIDKMFKLAIENQVSDIHIEPNEDFIMLRFRQDGDFFVYDKIDNRNTSAVVTRLKVLAKVKIDENKKPQD